MAIASEAAYYESLTRPWQRLRVSKNSLTTVAGRAFSSWLQGGTPAAGAAPTTAAVPTRATTGSLTASSGGRDFYDSAGIQRILRAVVDQAPTASAGGMVTICDRLSHQGGLSATVTTAQTTNLPTAALTRHTSGIGVEMGLEIYTQIGTTGTTARVSYTNTVPTAGQLTPLTTFGATGNREASRIIVLPLAEGDRGVTSVESATVTASTLTAGAFGVTLFYPLVHIPLDDILSLRGYADALYGFGAWFPIIESNACLMFVYHTSGALTGVVQADFSVCED